MLNLKPILTIALLAIAAPGCQSGDEGDIEYRLSDTGDELEEAGQAVRSGEFGEELREGRDAVIRDVRLEYRELTGESESLKVETRESIRDARANADDALKKLEASTQQTFDAAKKDAEEAMAELRRALREAKAELEAVGE